MTHAGIEAFDSTLQATNTWINDIARELGYQDRHPAYHALRVVLHALRDRLSVDQAAALGSQLPMLVRGIFFEGWQPKDKPLRIRHKDEFLELIARQLTQGGYDPEMVTRTVFDVLSRHVSKGEARHLKWAMPGEIRSLFPEEYRTLWF
jgi:uncharacterized protein (DUF2267 family)